MPLSPKEVCRILDSRGFVRKPTDWLEAGLAVPYDLLVQLPVFDALELGIEYNIANDFMDPPKEKIFLVRHAEALYLVSTEGHNYARYIRCIGPDVPIGPQLIRTTDGGWACLDEEG